VSLVEEFFAEECNEYVRGVLLDEASRRTSGSRYFTFNRFNVRLNFDSASAVIDDELNPPLEEAISLPEFLARLRA
jgi:hypothetical protein